MISHTTDDYQAMADAGIVGFIESLREQATPINIGKICTADRYPVSHGSFSQFMVHLNELRQSGEIENICSNSED